MNFGSNIAINNTKGYQGFHMTQQVINTGLAPNDGTGAPLRTAFTETNLNFDQIWTAGPVGSNVRIVDNRILTINTNGNLTLAPNGTGRVVANVDVVPNTSNIRNLGSTTQRWGTVYTQYLDITGNLSLNNIEVDDLTVGGNLTVNGTTTTINTANLDVADKVITIASGSATAAAANGAGIRVDGANATITYDHDTMSWVANLPLSVNGNITATTFVGDLTGTADFANTANSVTAANVSGLAQVATSGSYTDLSDIPTDVSAFDNDAGYITSAVANVISVNGDTGEVSLEIPTATSDLSNDSGFITANVVGNLSATGNISGNYILGNGSQLTGILPMINQLVNGNHTVTLANTGQTIFSQGSLAFNFLGSTIMESTLGPTQGGFAAANNKSFGISTRLGNTQNNWLFDPQGNLSASGNIIASHFVGNGTQLSGIPAANVTGLSTVATSGNYSDLSGYPTQVSAFDNDANYITSAVANVISVNGATGTVTLLIPTATSDLSNDSGFITANVSGNLSATGNITGNYILGNGSQLTGLPATYGNSNVVSLLSNFGSNTIYTLGSITGGNIYSGHIVIDSANSTITTDNGQAVSIGRPINGTGNISSTGNVIASANIIGSYILGNGSQLTGLPATYSNANVATFLAAYGSNTISTTGNITAGNLIGNISITGNVTGTSPDVTLVAGSYSWTFDNTGNLSIPAGGDILLANSQSQISAAGNIYAGQFVGSGTNLSNVATQSSGSWTLTPGTNTVSFTVFGGQTYSMWVTGNIPDGIVAWNATATVTNTNVPVIGQQFGWYYAAGNALVLTSMPDQFVGTAGAISDSAPAVANANVFNFTIVNNSGSDQTVYYGWTRISQ
jgi:hypothetical protein